MKISPTVIIGAGALVALVMLSGKKSTTTASAPSSNGKSSTNKPVGGLSSGISGSTTAGKVTPASCNKQTQYYDAKTKKCVKFWTPGTTDKQVEKKIRDLISVLINFNIFDFCVLPELIMMNANALGVVKETINNIWGIPVDQLPPTKDKKSPEWMMILWDKVAKIYHDVACE